MIRIRLIIILHFEPAQCGPSIALAPLQCSQSPFMRVLYIYTSKGKCHWDKRDKGKTKAFEKEESG
jgi:hypothetical protein